MNAYKCDICGKYFEDSDSKTGSIYPHHATIKGHHKITIVIEPTYDRDIWELFNGDVCPECMGYFSVGLCERGCQDRNVKMYAADYIRRCRNEMRTKTLGAPVREEAEEGGEF